MEETQKLKLLADRFGARIQEWGQSRNRVKLWQGRPKRLLRAAGRETLASFHP